MENDQKQHRYLLGNVKATEAPNFVMNPVELYQYLPKGQKFTIKRVYWLRDVKGEGKSGQHAHTNEDEIFIILKGKSTIILDDKGKKRKLSLKMNDIVWVPRHVWHGFEAISRDCVILALTSTNYDPQRKGYIADYQEFLTKIKKPL